jgi:hypothetical protein
MHTRREVLLQAATVAAFDNRGEGRTDEATVI